MSLPVLIQGYRWPALPQQLYELQFYNFQSKLIPDYSILGEQIFKVIFGSMPSNPQQEHALYAECALHTKQTRPTLY